jgi:hypothetical protein
MAVRLFWTPWACVSYFDGLKPPADKRVIKLFLVREMYYPVRNFKNQIHLF